MERRQEHSGASSTTGTTGSSIAGLRQYYVAVGSMKVKLETLLDLLQALQAERPINLVLHAGSRDTLDEMVANLATQPSCSVTCLHAGQSEAVAAAAAAAFKTSCAAEGAPPAASVSRIQSSADAAAADSRDRNELLGNRGWSVAADPNSDRPSSQSGPAVPAETCGAATTKEEPEDLSGPGARVLAITDVGLRALEARGAVPPVPLFIHYDLPVRRDMFVRRAAVAARARPPGGRPAIVVYFVVAGQLEELRAVEAHAGGASAIQEMPVHVAELTLH